MERRILEENILYKALLDTCVNLIARFHDVIKAVLTLYYDKCADFLAGHIYAGKHYRHNLFVVGALWLFAGFEDYSGSHSVERFLDDDESIEENDSILTPSEFEFDLYREEQDLEKKFRILLNMITSFASTVSMRLLYWGRIRLTCIYSTSGAVDEDLMWGKNGADDVWIPTQEEVLRYLEQKGKTIDDIPAERRNLIWPKQ